jgi:hypothetical protein
VAAGDREISGCARGLFWLQKSTSGAGSTPSGMGLAPTPHAREGNLPARFCLVQRGFCFAQRGEEASWPARATLSVTVTSPGSVESRRVHAAANPRVRAAAMPSGRAWIPVMRGQGDARATAPVNLGDAEGFIADGRRPGPASAAAFDEAAERGGPGGTADAVLVLSSRRGVSHAGGSRQRASEATSRARFAADKAATGRQRAEELSIAAPPGPRGALLDAGARASNPGHTRRAGRERWLKLEGRRQATLHPWIDRRSNDRRPIGAGAPAPRGEREPARMGIGGLVQGARES